MLKKERNKWGRQKEGGRKERKTLNFDPQPNRRVKGHKRGRGWNWHQIGEILLNWK